MKKLKNKISILKLLWGVMTKSEKLRFFALLILGLISSIAILVPTQVISIIISRLSGEDVKVLGIIIPNSISYVKIIVFGGIISYLMRFLSFSYSLNMEKLIKKVVANLRIETYSWLITPRKNMDLKMTQGDALYRLNQAPEAITTVTIELFTTILPEILSSILAFVYILLLDWQSVPLLLAGMVLVVCCVIFRTKIEKKISLKTEKSKSAMSNTLANSITNLPLITLYKSMLFETSIFDKKVDRFYTEQKKQINLRWIYWSLVRLIQVVCTFVIIYLCAKRIYEGTLLVGSVIIITNYVAQIFSPIQIVGYFATTWIDCKVSVERLYDIKPIESLILPQKSANIEEVESLELKDVATQNNENFKIENLNLKFEKGKLTVVTGESGSGKSTLIRLISGICEKTTGEFFINGDKRIGSTYQLVDKMSVSMQTAYIFNRDVKLNVLYPNGEEEKESRPIIEMLSMKRLYNRKYDENQEQNLENMLSGGEKKRIGISRALLKQADIYIFDEPTNDLDNKNAKNVIDSICALKDNAIVIVVTHDDRVKERADNMVYFANTPDGIVVTETEV